MTGPENERLARVETQQQATAADVTEIKEDVKELCRKLDTFAETNRKTLEHKADKSDVDSLQGKYDGLMQKAAIAFVVILLTIGSWMLWGHLDFKQDNAGSPTTQAPQANPASPTP